MKKILLALTITTLLFTGCSKTKSKEEHCREAITHIANMKMKTNSYLKKEMEDPEKKKKYFDRKIKSCVKKVDREGLDCFIKAKSKEEMNKCNKEERARRKNKKK